MYNLYNLNFSKKRDNENSRENKIEIIYIRLIATFFLSEYATKGNSFLLLFYIWEEKKLSKNHWENK